MSFGQVEREIVDYSGNGTHAEIAIPQELFAQLQRNDVEPAPTGSAFKTIVALLYTLLAKATQNEIDNEELTKLLEFSNNDAAGNLLNLIFRYTQQIRPGLENKNAIEVFNIWLAELLTNLRDEYALAADPNSPGQGIKQWDAGNLRHEANGGNVYSDLTRRDNTWTPQISPQFMTYFMKELAELSFEGKALGIKNFWKSHILNLVATEQRSDLTETGVEGLWIRESMQLRSHLVAYHEEVFDPVKEALVVSAQAATGEPFMEIFGKCGLEKGLVASQAVLKISVPKGEAPSTVFYYYTIPFFFSASHSNYINDWQGMEEAFHFASSNFILAIISALLEREFSSTELGALLGTNPVDTVLPGELALFTRQSYIFNQADHELNEMEILIPGSETGMGRRMTLPICQFNDRITYAVPRHSGISSHLMPEVLGEVSPGTYANPEIRHINLTKETLQFSLTDLIAIGRDLELSPFRGNTGDTV